MKSGVCALTGTYGKYVKAHILPEALTKPSVPGEHFIQSGQNERPIRRWTSWYDPGLVTADGERVLSNYDNWAISELRRLNLVWSSDTRNQICRTSDWHPINDVGHGVRIIEGIDGNKMRLFLLSLLWRAAASRLPELRQIRIPQRHISKIAQMLINANPNPLYFYPSCIIQLTGVGPRHNFTPIPSKKNLENRPSVRIFRFYLDGLAIHFHRDISIPAWKSMGDLCVQNSERLGIVTVPFEVSRQNEVLEVQVEQAQNQWGDVLSRLSR